MEDSRGALNESQSDGNSGVIALANLARLSNSVLRYTRLTITDRKRQTEIGVERVGACCGERWRMGVE